MESDLRVTHGPKIDEKGPKILDVSIPISFPFFNTLFLLVRVVVKMESDGDGEDDGLRALSQLSEAELDARFVQEKLKVTYEDGSVASPLSVELHEEASGLRKRNSSKPTKRDKDDEESKFRLTRERYEELRTKVHIKTVKERVNLIMNFYYLILGLFFWGYYRSLSAHGHDRTTVYFAIIGFGFLMLSFFADWIATRFETSNPAIEANFGLVSGVTRALAVPILFATTFAFVWMNTFFNKSWRDVYLSFKDFIHI